MTKQEIFTKVARHLLAQNAKSSFCRGDLDLCRYRDPRGRKCAVGCLIADTAYRTDLENLGVFSRDVKEALLASGVDLDDYTLILLDELQGVHDKHNVSEWRTSLKEIASRWGFAVEF